MVILPRPLSMAEKNKRKGSPALYKGMKPLNPTGRPKGSLNKYTLLAKEIMSDKGPEIVNKIVAMAMEGDVHCLKMCIDRILPVHKAVDPNRSKNDSQIIINVASIDSIEQKALSTPKEKLVNPKVKEEEEVIIEVAGNG